MLICFTWYLTTSEHCKRILYGIYCITRFAVIVLPIFEFVPMRKTRKPTIRFLNLIDDASTRVEFIEASEMVKRIARRELLNMIDVREYREFLNSHIEHCKHISKGVLERDIEFHYPELSAEIILYCSDGLRSILAGDALLKMGYSNIRVLQGGFQAWKEAGGKICLA